MTEKDFEKYFSLKYRKTSSFTSGLAFMISDALMIMLSIGSSFFIINTINDDWIWLRSFVNYWVYLIPALAVFYSAGLYPGLSHPPADEIKKFGICTFFIYIGICFSIFVEEADTGLTFGLFFAEHLEVKWPVITAFALAWPIAVILLAGAREFVRHIFSGFRWYGVPAVFYVKGDSGNFIIDRFLKRTDLGYKPAVIIDSETKEPYMYKDIPVFPHNDKITEAIKKTGIKNAFIVGWKEDLTGINSYFRYTMNIPRMQELNTISSNVRDFGGALGFASTHNLTFGFSLFIKRCVDIFLLLISSPVTIPLVLIVSILVKCTSKGPVFYGHKRIGRNGKEFKCWKFRSMAIDADKQLEKILAENPKMREEWERDRKFTDDPRVTKIGKILRKTSIDEIPQFFNVLTGEMSFIGPRPVTKPELEKYGSKADYVLTVKPGLSGMWQISGRSDTGYEERITLDSYYIQNWSVWLDLWIIIKTIYVVLKGKGAY